MRERVEDLGRLAEILGELIEDPLFGQAQSRTWEEDVKDPDKAEYLLGRVKRVHHILWQSYIIARYGSEKKENT